MAIAIDANVFGTQSSGGTLKSPSFNTAAANETILVFWGIEQNTGTITGMGDNNSLTWSRVAIATGDGFEHMSVWGAFSASAITNGTITGTANTKITNVTVLSFSGADQTGGLNALGTISPIGSFSTGPYTITVTTTRDQSLVLGAGAYGHIGTAAVPAGQSIIRQLSDATNLYNFSVQQQNSLITPIGNATINGTINGFSSGTSAFVAIEVLPPAAAAPTNQTYMTLTGAGNI